MQRVTVLVRTDADNVLKKTADALKRPHKPGGTSPYANLGERVSLRYPDTFSPRVVEGVEYATAKHALGSGLLNALDGTTDNNVSQNPVRLALEKRNSYGSPGEELVV